MGLDLCNYLANFEDIYYMLGRFFRFYQEYGEVIVFFYRVVARRVT